VDDWLCNKKIKKQRILVMFVTWKVSLLLASWGNFTDGILHHQQQIKRKNGQYDTTNKKKNKKRNRLKIKNKLFQFCKQNCAKIPLRY